MPKNKSTKKNKGGKRNDGVAAFAAKGRKPHSQSGKNKRSTPQLKGEVLRVMRTHGFLREVCKKENPTEYFVSGRDLYGAIAGDIVLFEKAPLTKRAKDGDSLPQARVTKVIKAEERLMTGTIVIEDGNMKLQPDSFGSRYPLRIVDYNGYSPKEGDKVSFAFKSRGDKHHNHTVIITGIYGSALSARVCVNAYLEEKGIVADCNDISAFPEEVAEEARLCGTEVELTDEEYAKRIDLRDLPIFTIDGADTKDIDDAISIERTEGGYKLGVHIADVSHYVKEDSELDKDAFSRGTSVYIADMVVPMLPQSLSNGICSLNPKVDRLAFSCLMEISKSGELKSFKFKKSIIHSRIQGVYSEINAILANTAEQAILDKYGEVIDQIPIMNELATVLKKNRSGRFAPALESAECKIICDEKGAVVDIKRRESGENAVSEGIIEEFMLLANNSAARLAMENDFPFVYRVHEQPSGDKLLKLTDTMAGLGISVPALKPTAESLSKILEAAKAFPDKFDVINMAVLRTMMKAKYSEEPLGHFGLVMKEYAHFTSPIRRYPDLSIHRILSEYVEFGTGRLTRKFGKFAHESSLKSSNTELRAVTAERDCNKFFYAEYMSSHIDEEFDGVISGITEISIYVMLENTVEGRVLLPDGEYQTDNVSVSNSITGTKYTLGDKIRIKCVGCNIPLGNVDFETV